MPLEPYRAYHAMPDDLLKIASIRAGRFLYIAFAGGVDVPIVMKSRSTYVPGAFGGLEGRRLKTGDTLSVASNRAQKKPQVSDALPEELRPVTTGEVIRYVPRVENDEPAVTGKFSVSTASDRTGYRLAGDLDIEGGSITSEPVCPGAIQLPPGGEPIVLMADAPTVGGYKIVGGVISADLGVLAQRMPGEAVILEPVSIQAAQRESARRVEVIDRVREWALA
jgi:allophanate hydrolase subunit 2